MRSANSIDKDMFGVKKHIKFVKMGSQFVKWIHAFMLLFLAQITA